MPVRKEQLGRLIANRWTVAKVEQKNFLTFGSSLSGIESYILYKEGGKNNFPIFFLSPNDETKSCANHPLNVFISERVSDFLQSRLEL